LDVQAQMDDLDLDASTQMGIYRFVQECLTNIGKHAHATRVSIKAWKDIRQAAICIADNGVGFATAGIASSAHGLAGMRSRIQDLGGRLVIETSAMQGARITAVIPRPATSNRGARAHPVLRINRAGKIPTSSATRQSTEICARTKARIGTD
jgi:signal transduction histidine kinase